MAEPQGWQVAEAWARQWSGEDCAMCADAQLEANPFSVKIADLEASTARLSRNQYMPGWTVVVLRRHACELFELDRDEQAAFFGDVARVARALQQVYSPVKLNYAVFGNLTPHIHCHVVPRFAHEDPTRPLNMGEQEVRLSEAELFARVGELRAALESERSN